MHVTFRESHGLEETATPFDPDQAPADMVVLSFSDSDLGAFAAGWHRAGGALPSLRLCNLVGLRHPVSVDTYMEKTAGGAKAILVRLIGGEAYWPYGLASLQDLARRKGIALAVLPADGREDARLDALSTLPVSTLRRLTALCDAGGAVAAQAALSQLALAAGLYAPPVIGDKRVPDCGFYQPGQGVVGDGSQGGVAVVFYRSYLTAADTDPVDALIRGFAARGLPTYGIFAPSLKGGSADWVRSALARLSPVAVVNATAFSAKGEDGTSPLDTGAPVFQVALSTARRRDWASSARGLSPADLAMHVVLPEVDGRIGLGVISFKSPGKRDPDLQFSRFAHRADAALVEAAVARVMGWSRLAQTPRAERSVAVVLSTYPGRAHQMAHAVGLDALASTEAVLARLAAEGYDVAPQPLELGVLTWPVSEYLQALKGLPSEAHADLEGFGPAESDPSVRDGAFQFPALRLDKLLVALQPERSLGNREDHYHDLSRVPRHAYVAFYLWLKSQGLQALIHMGAHGTLEWLPGKSVALSRTCWPELLTPCPVAVSYTHLTLPTICSV